MCLLIFAHQVSPDYPLLIAANRDEFHARPTTASTFWKDHPQVLAGQDLQQGGTWMGITRGGRFAAVTNYRDPAATRAAPRSRGALPIDYLTGSQSPKSYLQMIAGVAHDYAGFNLLVGDSTSLWYFANSDERAPQQLQPGIYGLSNARLDTPWPKVETGKAQIQRLVNTLTDSRAANHDALAAVVSDPTPAHPDELRALNLDSPMEPTLSAQFIVTETYGTRSCTTLWVDAQGNTSWREQSFDSRGLLSTIQQYDF
jgi:uncharacterized protein with NRDE domain